MRPIFELPKVLCTGLLSITLLACTGGDEADSLIPQTRDSSGNSTISVELGDAQQVEEQSTITINAGSVSSPGGDIVSYDWAQVANGAPLVDINQADAQISFDAPDVIANTNLVFRLLVTDESGNTGSDIIILTIIADPIPIDELPIMYNEPPVAGQSLTVSLATNDTVGNVAWTVVSAPEGSALTSITGAKSVTFQPDVAGDYTIQAVSSEDGTIKTTTFTALQSFALDTTKVKGAADATSVQGIINVIENQSWIASTTLDEAALTALATVDDSGLTVLGFDEQFGLLVEYDETSATVLDYLEEIRLTANVDEVSNRIYEGENAPRDEATVPNDGSAFDDEGDNWHLEYINATEAWDITQGSADIVIGISDSGFDTNHIDLQSRVFELLTDNVSEHGTQAAGAIGAVTDNNQGISGINWVSDLLLTGTGIDAIQALFKLDNVPVINSSWAIPGLIDASFDPLDSNAVNMRDDYANDMTRPYRRLAKSRQDKLFVWPAGNGIANGAGNVNGVFGVNARHHSPALHYDDKANLNKQSNVIFAAAVLPDNRLAYYSNYGEAVDLAAPTSFRSTTLNGGYDADGNFGDGDAGYSGTSASTAIVSGVASLIYSLNPEFSGEEVKRILLDSAVAMVTERYISRTSMDTEVLAHPIPIVDAEQALELAQARMASRVAASVTIPDPSVPDVQIVFSTTDAGLSVSGVDWTLESSADGVSAWQAVTNAIEADDTVDATLDAANRFHRIVADVTVAGGASDVQMSTTVNFAYNIVDVDTVETVALGVLSDAVLSVDLLDAPPITPTLVSDVDGAAQLFLLSGSYKLRGSLVDFQESATRFTIDGRRDLNVSLIFSANDVENTGALSGFVRAEDGSPIEDASVRISGGTQTNGFFASSLTDENGYYVFSNVSKKDSDGADILSFGIEASADTFSTSTRESVRVVSGEDTTENLVLLEPRPFDNIFSDDFESGTNGWVLEGMWNLLDLTAGSIVNTLVDSGNTLLAPDEAGPQALLPAPISGAVVWWYGQADTGSFIGTPSPGSLGTPNGGTSIESNEGTIVSPSINLVGRVEPFLRFRTWWEIESVNPNSNGFDIMEVQVSTDNGENYTTLKKLNPFVDPNDEDREAKPFSSGGYNRKPLWVQEEYDLTPYVGQTVRFRFSFDSNDALYNGFRGWLLDDLIVGDYVLQSVVTKPNLNKAADYSSQKSSVRD